MKLKKYRGCFAKIFGNISFFFKYKMFLKKLFEFGYSEYSDKFGEFRFGKIFEFKYIRFWIEFVL